MKRLIGMFMVASMMVGCSNDNEPQLENDNEAQASTSYMAITIRSGNSSSRAAGEFEDGTAEENKVANIDFYFYDEKGNPFTVNAQGTNCFNCTETSLTDKTGNIDAVSNAIVVLSNLNGKYPDRMVTVVNPKTSGELAGKTMEQMQKSVAAYGQNGATNFTMTNSVYLNGENVENYTVVKDKAYKDKSTAESNAVEVYVERVLAKFVVDNQVPDDSKLGSTGDLTIDSDKADAGAADKVTIRAVIDGWTVSGGMYSSSTPVTEGLVPNCYLVKQIDKGWNSTNPLGTPAWNSTGNFRSYWAITPSDDQKFAHQYSAKSFQAAGTAQYFTENTLQAKSTDGGLKDRSKLIVKAHFVDGESHPIVPAKWVNEMYTLQGLKNAMANSVKSSLQIVKTSTTTARPIADYITFNQVTPKKPYVSTPVFDFTTLKGQSDDKLQIWDGVKWVDYVEGTHKTKVEAIMSTILPAYIWFHGGYYFQGVKHLGDTGSYGEYGVVRNHIYKFTLKTIKGLGTPICDENKIIDPVKPVDDESYIAAKLNILSWKIVSHDVNLE